MNLLTKTSSVLLLLIFLFCCKDKIVGSGNVTTQTIATADYDQIALTGSMDVHLIPGTEGQIEVTAEDNLHQYINIAVTNGTLNIGKKSGASLTTNREIYVTVPFQSLSGVRIEGSGDIDTQGAENIIRASTFKASVTGSGDINLKLEVTEKVEANITGSGDIALSGSTESLQVLIDGSGDFEGFDLSANNATVTISGSGDAEVMAKTSLRAIISGSGDIAYKGSPTITRNITGSVRITRSQ